MTSFHDYVVTTKVHEGGETALYHGLRSADRAPVMIKVHTSDRPTVRAIAKLRHEHAIMMELDRASALIPHSGEQYGAGLALIMMNMPGRTLREMIDARALDLRAVLRIAASGAGALELLHRHGFIHKDVSPVNLVIEPETMAVQLIGFGATARLSHETQRAESPDALEGTLAYMAPEQTGRMNRLVDPRSDLYSLGVVLYEALTGSLPFQTTDPMELVYGHIARTPPSPREVSPEVPEVVSDIVMKLMAKMAEGRYQSAHGLAVDLEECLARLSAAGAIAPFPLGLRGASNKIQIPQKLYGRDAECAALIAAFDRVSRGATELLLISGYSGIGKSALVNEIHKSIARQRGGHFISGKFDQVNRSTPYAPILHAFQQLMKRLLTERAEALALWESRLTGALGANARVLVDVIPEIALIIGLPPEVPELGPTESENRFHLVFQSFVGVFTTAAHPLVLFLDDLQWIDPASMKLLQRLLTDSDRACLLVVGAYRDNEVDDAHPLSLVLDRLRRAGRISAEITLGPLDLPSITQLCAETLCCDGRRAAPLAQFLKNKTQGNPFFLNQVLLGLEKDGQITFDARSGSFSWEMARVQESLIPDDVVTFMAGAIQRLSPESQRILKLGACVGYQFDLRTSSIISGRSLSETAADLWAALRDRLIEPVDPEYKFVHTSAEQPDPALDFNVSYRFLHDRVQQAAYSLIGDTQKYEAHLQIGRSMLASAGRELTDEELFDVVNHLNFGASLITDPGERADLTHLNLLAGKRAKAASAYEAAVGYLQAGISLLGPSAPESAPEPRYDLTLKLHVELAECEFLTGEFEQAEALFAYILSYARSKLEKAHVYSLWIILYSTQGKSRDAVSVGQTALALFGIDLPAAEQARRTSLDGELAEIQEALARGSIEGLVDRPALLDPEMQAALKLLAKLGSPAYLVSADLYALITAKQVNISLKHGHSDVSAIGYMAYALILAGRFGRYSEAYAFGKLALDLNETLKNTDLRCRLNHMFGLFIHFKQPLRSSLTYMTRSYQAGLESGDFIYLANTCMLLAQTRLYMGDDLHEALAEADKLLALSRRLKAVSASASQVVTRQTLANLLGRTKGRDTLSDGEFLESAFVEALERQAGNVTTACWYYTAKLQLSFLYGSYADALSMLALAEKHASGAFGMYSGTEISFYACLTLLAPGLPAPETGGDAAERLALFERHAGRLAELAVSCPENYLHKHQLVLAESARASGRELEAMALYEQAMESARQRLFPHHEALACELCAKFHVAAGRMRSARIQMTEAYHRYLRWGARVKAEDLLQAYPSLIARSEERSPWEASWSGGAGVTAAGRGVGALDVVTVIQASRAIAGELDLEKAIARLMDILIKNAGAQTGVLLIEREGKLMIEAVVSTEPGVVEVKPSIPIDASSALPQTIVQYVARTKEPVILGDAGREAQFSADPYIVSYQPKSILCLPLMHQGRFVGALYLENNALYDAFPPSRLDVFQFLSSMAAIAIENGLLYADVQQATDRLRGANELLEHEVAQRTEQLRETNARLAIELVHRGRAEEARAALQQEIIQTQKTRLAELATPFIPITDLIMVMPLVGTMDAQRAEQMLDTALQGAKSNRARVVILDITGVSTVDGNVAAILLRTANALGMLGVKAVITGIRPEVAQTLVALGVDLGAVAIQGTLQSGIVYALNRSGETRLFRSERGRAGVSRQS